MPRPRDLLQIAVELTAAVEEQRKEIIDLKETILYLTERIDALEPAAPNPDDYTFLADDLLDDPNAYEWSEMVQDPSYTEEAYEHDNIWR